MFSLDFVFTGHGTFAERDYQKGEFIVEYPGVLKQPQEVENKDQTYMFYFRHQEKCMW